MAFFRYWNYTTCIEVDSLEILERKITQILEKEDGCYRLLKLPKLSSDLRQASEYSQKKLSNLWIVCLFKGIDRWSVIKTFPTGLMCDRASNSNKSRLSNLTKQIKCNAFHLEVYRDVDGFLFESNAMGNTHLSGRPPLGDLEHFSFHDEQQVDRLNSINNFLIIDVPKSFKQAFKINESPETQKQQEKINELDSDSPKYFDLVVKDPGYTQRIDLALADLFDPNRDYWFIENDLVYKIYSNLKQLQSLGAKIMYFKPPNSYQPFTQPKVDFFQNVSDLNKNEMPF